MKLRSNRIITTPNLRIAKPLPTKYKAPVVAKASTKMLPCSTSTDCRTIVFDLETTGLPPRTERGLPEYWRSDLYNSARIVSIAWKIMGAYPEMETVKDEYHIIKPEGFSVPPSSTAIHGITQEMAEQGEALPDILAKFVVDMTACQTIVAHNVSFDMSVLRSELFRLSWRDAINTSYRKDIVCTMREGKTMCKLPKIPRLGELFKVLCGKELLNAHNAQADVEACSECYKALQRKLQGSKA
jgi:DNA polymerase III epsilon subunit-like protein